MTVAIIWLLMDAFTIFILFMDSAPHVEYSDVVPCGAFVDTKNYPMDGLVITSNLTSLLRNLNYKQPLQMMPIWNGFHSIILTIEAMKVDAWMVYLFLVHVLN